MRKLVLGLVVFLAIVNSTADVHADAADVFNRTAPAFSEEGNGNSEWLYARKSDGTIWHKTLGTGGVAGFGSPCGAGGAGGGWVSDGNPSVGATTSGPQIGWTQTNFVQSWLFAETGSGLYVKPGTGAWTSVTVAPPGGFTSGITVASDFANGAMHLAARGGSSIPYVLQVNAPLNPGGPLSVGAWTQVGTTSVASAPAIASPGYRRDVLSLDASTQVQITSCAFPTCWSTPTALAGPITSFFSPSALWFDLNGSLGGPSLVVAANVSGNAYTKVLTSGTWGATASRAGATINSAVAVSINSSNPGSPRLAAHFTDGNYRINCSGGTTWLSVGQP